MAGGAGSDPHLRAIGIARPAQRWALRALAGVLIPVAAFLILLEVLRSELAALAVSWAIPLGWALASGARRRRVDPIALIAAAVLVAAVAIALASGGSVLPLKLRRAVITGTLGVACLCSVVVRRPLLPAAMNWLERRWPRSERLVAALGGRADPRTTVGLTLIIGGTLLVDAVAQVALAVSVSTATFVATAGLTRIAVFTVGLGACALYARRASSRSPVRPGLDPYVTPNSPRR